MRTLDDPTQFGCIGQPSYHGNCVQSNALFCSHELLKEPSPKYKIDVYSCRTVEVQNLHAMGHVRGQFPSLLQYAQNLANTVYESIKSVVRWAAYYCTHKKCYLPVVSQATPLDALPRMTNLKQRESSMIENER